MSLYINLKKEKHKKFATKMVKHKCRLPNMNSLFISLVKEKSGPLNQFLLHCAPHSLQILRIECSYSFAPFCSTGLVEVASGVTGGLFLQGLKIWRASFEDIVKAASYTRQLVFDSCNIDSSQMIDFSGPDYR